MGTLQGPRARAAEARRRYPRSPGSTAAGSARLGWALGLASLRLWLDFCSISVGFWLRLDFDLIWLGFGLILI